MLLGGGGGGDGVALVTGHTVVVTTTTVVVAGFLMGQSGVAVGHSRKVVVEVRVKVLVVQL